MIVWPGLRRSVSAIQRLFNSASLYAPLTHTAVPVRAAPGTTATFTRATTKTVENNDGYLVTLLAGEIGFPGARRVDNLIRLGAAQSSTLAIAANVTMTLPAGAYQFSMGAGTGTATFSGTGGATGTLAASASGRVFVAKTITAGTLIVTGSAAILNDIQVVSMVAETDQTTIREYVSVGVESAPYFHGNFVDGVKTFSTDLAGNALTTMRRYNPEGAGTNLCLQSNSFNTTWTKLGASDSFTQNVVGPDGATSAWSIVAGATAGVHGPRQQITPASSAAHVFWVLAKQNTAGYYLELFCNIAAGGNGFATFNLATGTVGNVSGAGVTSAISAFGSQGYYLCELRFTSQAALSNFDVRITNSLTVNQTYTGDGASSISIYGSQIVLGSFAGSYIATTTTAQTRDRDQLAYSAAGNLDETEDYWVYAEHTPMYQDTGEAFAVSTWNYNDGVGNAGMMLRGSVGGVGDFFTGGNGATTGATTANTVANGVSRKIVGTASGAVAKVCMNGEAVATGVNSKPALPATTMYIGANAAITGFGNVGPIYIGQRQLSASEMQAITAA